MANLKLSHIYKVYENGHKAVNDFCIDIEDKELIVFVGPSGCGKSTTLRMIAGLETITAGDLFIGDTLVNDMEPKDRDIAMVFQNYALYPHMTVYENMAFGLRNRHVPEAEIKAKVLEAAKILDIEDYLQRKPKAMSGGQRQRVALGRAIVRDPKVFLLDEPLSNLDAKLRAQMRTEITKLHKKLGTTFIYVTHDQVEAMTMGSKIVVMRDGVIQQVDSPMNLYDYPANEFVAGFIGTPQMNFIPGKLSYEGKEIGITLSNGVVKAEKDELFKLNKINILKNKEIILGVRPEHIKIVAKSAKNAHPYTITAIEHLGNESNLFVDSVGGDLKLTVKTLRNDELTVGSQVYLQFEISKIHLFDKETTNTLLERIPNDSFVSAKVLKDGINVFGSKLKLGNEILDVIGNEKELFVNIPTKAISVGGDLTASIVKKEKINDKWLIVAKEKDEYLFVLSDEYVDGDKLNFSIDTSLIDFLNNKLEVVWSKIEQDNIISGKLIPDERTLPVLNKELVQSATLQKIKANNFIDEKGKTIKVKFKRKKVFKYSLLSNEYTPSDDVVIKVYSLLGKKFSLHNINFILPTQKICIVDEGGIEANVTKVLNYVDRIYYEVMAEGQKLLVSSKKAQYRIGDKLRIDIDVNDIGIYDVNFGVRIA